MQPGGFGGGGQGNGYPPGGYPPAPGAPGAPQPYGAPQQPQPYAAPQQAYGAPQPPQQYGAPAQQPYGAPQQQPYGAPQQQPYGAPQQQPYGAPQQQPYGAPAPGQYPGAPGQVAQQAAQMGYGAAPGMPGMPGLPGMMAAPRGNSFGQAQSALAGAGGMMKMMKYAFIGIGGLCALGGLAMVFTVDVITGISVAFTGVVFVVVAIAVLPRFSGMLGQATAMVDGFAAKEQLAMTGIPAMGRLISVQQTGRLVNYNPEIQAVVEVHHPQLGPYQTQTTAIVPQIAIPRAQPGGQVQVRVSPQNQHEIALVF